MLDYYFLGCPPSTNERLFAHVYRAAFPGKASVIPRHLITRLRLRRLSRRALRGPLPVRRPLCLPSSVTYGFSLPGTLYASLDGSM